MINFITMRSLYILLFLSFATLTSCSSTIRMINDVNKRIIFFDTKSQHYSAHNFIKKFRKKIYRKYLNNNKISDTLFILENIYSNDGGDFQSKNMKVYFKNIKDSVEIFYVGAYKKKIEYLTGVDKSSENDMLNVLKYLIANYKENKTLKSNNDFDKSFKLTSGPLLNFVAFDKNQKIIYFKRFDEFYIPINKKPR